MYMISKKKQQRSSSNNNNLDDYDGIKVLLPISNTNDEQVEPTIEPRLEQEPQLVQAPPLEKEEMVAEKVVAVVAKVVEEECQVLPEKEKEVTIIPSRILIVDSRGY